MLPEERFNSQALAGGRTGEAQPLIPTPACSTCPSRTVPAMAVLTEPDPDVSDLRYIRSGTLGPGSAHPGAAGTTARAAGATAGEAAL